MKKLFTNLFIMLLISIFLVACQGTKDQQVGGAEEKDSETSQDKALSIDGNIPEEITIDGLADHYHTGDKMELTAVLDAETEADHWHWYSRENADEEWKVVEGQETKVFTEEAKVNGLEVKVVLFNHDQEPSFQSKPVTIVIDDHHGHDEASKKIYQGYFEDSQIKNRELSDWEGDWQSVYPYLQSGELDPVFKHKAEDGDMTEAEYKEYYDVGYKTDINNISIKDNVVTFTQNGKEYSGKYESDGYKVLNYAKGNRGVRFSYKLVSDAENMPQYIQFSDHNIFPVKSHHFHLYWGDDRQQVLDELTNWPTYYPDNQEGVDIIRDMLAH